MDGIGRAGSGTETESNAWSSCRGLRQQQALLDDEKAGYFGCKIQTHELFKGALNIGVYNEGAVSE